MRIQNFQFGDHPVNVIVGYEYRDYRQINHLFKKFVKNHKKATFNDLLIQSFNPKFKEAKCKNILKGCVNLLSKVNGKFKINSLRIPRYYFPRILHESSHLSKYFRVFSSNSFYLKKYIYNEAD